MTSPHITMIDIEKLKREQAERVEKMIERLRHFPEEISEYFSELSSTKLGSEDNDVPSGKKHD